MKLAIMQPYFFPYIGYWQLIRSVDRFIIFDDVNYINRGWVNRNRILINGAPSYFTVPLHQASQNKKIYEIKTAEGSIWRDKLLKMIEITYRRASCFSDVFPVVEELISCEKDNLSEYLAYQLKVMAVFMDIDTEFVKTSRIYGNEYISGEDRILDICKKENATIYINPQGGQYLYNYNRFEKLGVELYFLFVHSIIYKQRSPVFVPYLSIIDVLMEVGPKGIKRYLDAFELHSKKNGG